MICNPIHSPAHLLTCAAYTSREHLVCKHHPLQQSEARISLDWLQLVLYTYDMAQTVMQGMSLQPTTTGKQRSRRPLPSWVKLPCWQALRGSTASGPVVTGNHCIIVRRHCICVCNGKDIVSVHVSNACQVWPPWLYVGFWFCLIAAHLKPFMYVITLSSSALPLCVLTKLRM